MGPQPPKVLKTGVRSTEDGRRYTETELTTTSLHDGTGRVRVYRVHRPCLSGGRGMEEVG